MSADMNLLLRLRAIDYNHNNKIDGNQEIKKAQQMGIQVDPNQPKTIEQLAQDSSKVDLQGKLNQIDQSQTVDNKASQNQEEERKKRFMAIG